ncbi:acetyl-CoA carboxylase biotin carboxyl carrier protein [Rubritalea tangerina]
MDEHDLSYFHLEKDDFNLKLKKGLDADSIQAAFAAMPAPVAAAPAPVAAAAPAAAAAAPTADAAPAAEGEAITSPMVGTFYRKPAPDSPNFLEVGDTISEGQTICIIEAMKVMNEIKAEKSGTIASIAVDDATPVQFGDTLFTLK